MAAFRPGQTPVTRRSAASARASRPGPDYRALDPAGLEKLGTRFWWWFCIMALICPAGAQACAQLMSGAQAQTIAGARHGDFGQPERINARTTEFIAAAGADQAR